MFAGNHGVAEQGVSPYPASVTKQMLAAFTAGKAAVNQICSAFDAGLRVFDLALDIPTGDITREPALDERACAATMAFGMQAIAGGADVLVLGEMGIANTTVAAAVCHGLYGGAAEDWVGAGTGAQGDVLFRKTAAVRAAVALNEGSLDDPLEVLRRLGGRELAAIAGAILSARHERVPVILDGYVVTAAAAVLYAMDPTALDHCLAGHVSAEQAHGRLLERLGLRPMLDSACGSGKAPVVPCHWPREGGCECPQGHGDLRRSGRVRRKLRPVAARLPPAGAGPGESDDRPRTPAGTGGKDQPRPVKGGQPLHDGQAQPGPAPRAGVQRAFPMAGRKVERQFLLAEARSRILHPEEGRSAAIKSGHEAHLAPLGRELHGIGDEVQQHLPQGPLIRPQAQGAGTGATVRRMALSEAASRIISPQSRPDPVGSRPFPAGPCGRSRCGRGRE